MLDALERYLGERPFPVGEINTESDIRLFVTPIRFDSLPRTVQARPASRDDVKHYSIKARDPSGIVPLGPDKNSILSGPERVLRHDHTGSGAIACGCAK
jgi:glutathionyl-hydroquinone reductase